MAITIGLMLVLVAITTTVNEMVIRALRSAHQIEAADKAYFVAEGGIEDALYELSAHTAGYKTVDLDDNDVRNADFTESVPWNNKWEIKNELLNACDDELSVWQSGYQPTYCGRIYGGEKMVINLFTDDADTSGIGTNGINGTPGDPSDINALHINTFTARFRLPTSLVASNLNAFSGTAPLKIDNDGDFGTSTSAGPEALLGLNEDGHEYFGYAPNTCYYSGGVKIDDDDCDILSDEDSQEDPVILWKLIDQSGNFFLPLRGCKNKSPIHSSHPGNPNMTLCEKNFTRTGIEVSVSFSDTDLGFDQNGVTPITLQQFLTNNAGSDLQMEVIIVAPMEAIDAINRIKVPIPYYEYGIKYTEASGLNLPSTFFSIKSDGYYKDYKQSITTNVVPRATSRLLDLTIIQQ